MPELTVLEPWTYDNLGNMNYDSPELDVIYDLFAKDIYGTYDGEFVEPILHLTSELGDPELNATVTYTIQLSETPNQDVTIDAEDGFSISEDSFIPSASSNVDEPIQIIETPEVSVSTQLTQRYINLFDTYATGQYEGGVEYHETNCEEEPYTVLHNLEIVESSDSDSSFEAYCSNNSPLGYSELRPLYPGDYEYKDAIVGVQVNLASPSGAENAFIVSGQKLHIDVEDTVDKGEEFFTNDSDYQTSDETIHYYTGGKVKVWFKKKFYTCPSVFCEVRNATPPCRVSISNIDIRAQGGYNYGYFEFELVDFATGSDWQGECSVSWQAIGY